MGGAESPFPGTSTTWKAHSQIGEFNINEWFNELVAQGFISVDSRGPERRRDSVCVFVWGQGQHNYNQSNGR